MRINDRRDAGVVVGRVVCAGLTIAMGWIHLYLWLTGYREISIVGPLFLLNAIGSGGLALALLGVPRRWLAIVAGAAALFTVGTLGALILSLTVGLFGLTESLGVPLVSVTLEVESAGTVVLAAFTTVLIRARRPDRGHK